MAENKQKLAIITTIIDDWGGSEELWARTAPILKCSGFDITVYKTKINRSHPEFSKLLKQEIALQELEIPVTPFLHRLKIKISNRLMSEPKIIPHDKLSYLASFFHSKKPDLVVIAQGINFDGLDLGYLCMEMNIPYVLIAQKAVDFMWPFYPDRKASLRVYQKAAKCYFISKQNKLLTEEQFGVRFPNAEIVCNPVTICRKKLPMPTTKDGYRLACVGRYFLLDKGQDILIRIMAMPKWKERPVTITFIGSGNDKEALIEMSALLNVKNVVFLDYSDNITQLWQHYHALVLPSRSEGTPLVLLEAMACGRMSIVSTRGGNPELITDGITGFVGHANEESFDEAMERAWNARTNWDKMGNNALTYLNENIPDRPEEKFADSLKDILNA